MSTSAHANPVQVLNPYRHAKRLTLGAGADTVAQEINVLTGGWGGSTRGLSESTLAGQWHYLKEKTSDYVVIPAKAGIQVLKNIGRQADSGCRFSLA